MVDQGEVRRHDVAPYLIVLIITAGSAVAMWPLGVAGTRYGLVTATVLLVAVAVGADGLMAGGRRSRRRLVTSLVAGVLIALLLWKATPPTWSRLRAELDRVEIPAGATLTHASQGGNTLCFDYCPDVYRTYEADGSVADALEEFRAAFEQAGFDVTVASYLDYSDDAELFATRWMSRTTVRGKFLPLAGRRRTLVELEARG